LISIWKRFNTQHTARGREKEWSVRGVEKNKENEEERGGGRQDSLVEVRGVREEKRQTSMGPLREKRANIF
jgi:hypothetical protein